VPEGQLEQNKDPEDDENVPAGHNAHVVTLFTSFDVARETAYLPGAHDNVPEHVDDVRPLVEPHVPAGQDKHVGRK
jgi:hypothetical protein